MPWIVLVLLLLAAALVPAFVDVLILHRTSGFEAPDLASAVNLVPGPAISLALVALVTTWYGWWPDVFREGRRVRGWLWVIPATFIVVALLLTDYARLAEAGPALTATLLLATALIAAGEELAFRGVALTFLRDRFGEWTAAAIAAVLFGALHLTGGVVKAVLSIIFGYLLYVMRRVSGGLMVPILVHAAWDFSVFSSLTTTRPDTDADAGLVLTLVSFAALLAIGIGFRAVEPRQQDPGDGPVPPK